MEAYFQAKARLMDYLMPDGSAAINVDDATASWRETTGRGATSAIERVELDGGEDGVLRRSAVGTYGEVRHSFIDRREYHGVFAPGYRRVKNPRIWSMHDLRELVGGPR
jgi:hypothetical protein